MSDLKPCPFCGNRKPLVFEGRYRPLAFFVECRKRSCKVQPMAGPQKTAVSAIAAWNTRRGATP